MAASVPASDDGGRGKGFVRGLLNYDPVRLKFTTRYNMDNISMKRVIHLAIRRGDATSLAKVKEALLKDKGPTLKRHETYRSTDIPISEVS